MNHKQKVGYTVLGAIIMLIGIGVGSIVSPSLIAQHNGVFDEIVCSKLKVVDKVGNPAIILGSHEGGNDILVVDETGESGILLATSKRLGNLVNIANPLEKTAVRLIANKQMGNLIECAKLTVVDKSRKSAIELATDEDGNYIRINDKEGKIALDMLALKDDMNINGLYIYDKTGKHAVSMASIEMPNGQGSNGISINYAGEDRLALLTGESVGITISDRKGKVVWSAP